MKKIVLCQHYFNAIGGVETFIINFCKTFYKQYDITLLCRTIDKKTAIYLSHYVDVICIPSEKIECDTCIISSVLVDEYNFNFVKYKEVYQMIHSDWTEMKKFWDWKYKKTVPEMKFIAVSETARESFLREFGEDSVVIENIMQPELPKTQKTLRLLSFTRLTKEKGYERMKTLCDLFEKYNIPYIWDVYGTNPCFEKDYKNMHLHSPIMDDEEKSLLINSYDYICQLSDTESFCYTMYESLMHKVPVLVTPFPNAKLEIKDGENGYLIPFNMKITEKQIKEIAFKIPKNANYKQIGVKEKWEEILK